MIRDVSISSRTGYAYNTKRECIREACAILIAMTGVCMAICCVALLGTFA